MKANAKNLFLMLLLTAGSMFGQGFDLMNVDASAKVASSAPYTVTPNGIAQFRVSSPTTPFAVITGDTLVITKDQNTTSVANGGPAMPTASALQQNFPNPFNNATVIRYSLSEPSDVTITVYDMTGREVSTLVQGPKEPGTFSIGFANTTIASGTYIYRMIARASSGKTSVDTKKMLVLK